MAELAVLPDDSSSVDATVGRLIQSVVATIPAVDYASATARRAGKHCTVAFSSDLAMAVDQSQYDEGAGPCINATNGTVTSIEDVTTVMEWPRFREAATKMGLGSSLSVPLFTASGEPSIGLNLYSHQPESLRALAAAVVAQFQGIGDPESEPDASLDEGSKDLVCGVRRALDIRDEIQRGIGVVMAREQVTAVPAYTRLRTDAADANTSILEHVKSLTDPAPEDA